MRAGRLLFGLVVAVLIAVGASWATFKHDYVVHQREAVQWTALTLTKQTASRTPRPADADAALYLSNAAIDQALKQMVGTTIQPPAGAPGAFIVTVDNARVRRDLGLTGVALDVRVKSPQSGINFKMAVEGALGFRGIVVRRGDDERTASTAEFGLTVLKAEPQFALGFMDIPGRHFLSEAVASGLMLALDNHLAVSIPFEDRIGFSTGFSRDSTITVPDGTVTLTTSLLGKNLEQRFAFSAPVILPSGVWLLATNTPAGQGSVLPPSVPAVTSSELSRQIATLQDQVAQAEKPYETHGDFVLLVKGSTLVGLVDQLKALPPANRTVNVQSTAATGHFVSDDTVLVELLDPRDINAQMLIGPPTAEWLATKGVALATDLNMVLHSRIHVHVKPVRMGTPLGLEGGAQKHIAGTLELSNQMIGGRSVLLLGARMSCDTVTADVTTDGRLVVGPAKIDLIKVGLRWTMAVPPSLGQANVLLNDLPRRVAIESPHGRAQDVAVTFAHKAIEYSIHVTGASATQAGYAITANLDMRPVGSIDTPREVGAERQKFSDDIAAWQKSARACPAVDADMKVLFGGIEFGGNNEIVKFFRNALHDLTQGPGPNNEVVKALNNAGKDLTQGPGPNNDLVGRNGVVPQAVGRVLSLGGVIHW